MNPKPVPLKIQIPEPCSQSWDEMSPEGSGRHCAACAKTVVDFTRMTDAQILEVLRNSAGSCGRFTADQLGRDLIVPTAEKRFSFVGFYKFAASLLLVFSAGKVVAQEKEQVVFKHQNTEEQKPQKKITGFLKDREGEPLSGITVEVQGFGLKAISDVDGAYSLLIPDTIDLGTENRILISHPNYRPYVIADVIFNNENEVYITAIIEAVGENDFLPEKQRQPSNIIAIGAFERDMREIICKMANRNENQLQV